MLRIKEESWVGGEAGAGAGLGGQRHRWDGEGNVEALNFHIFSPSPISNRRSLRSKCGLFQTETEGSSSFPPLADRPRALGLLRTFKHKPPAGKHFSCLARARCPGNQACWEPSVSRQLETVAREHQHTDPWDLVAGGDVLPGGQLLSWRESGVLVETARSRASFAGPGTRALILLLAFRPFLVPWGQRSGWLQESPRAPGILQEGVTARGVQGA